MKRIHSGKRGFTLLELLIAVTISTVVITGSMALVIMASRLDRSIYLQQRSLLSAKKVIERINREIRLAENYLRITNDDGDVVSQGNTVYFNYYGESGFTHSFQLTPGNDNDYFTPNDNRFIFDPDTTTDGDEEVLCAMISPLDTGGAFSWTDTRTPLTIRMRTGDPVSGKIETDPDLASEKDENAAASDVYTGKGSQGVDINITVTPRNSSS